MKQQKSNENIRKLPQPLNMQKYKESDFKKPFILIKVRKDNKSKTVNINNNGEKGEKIKVNLNKNIQDIYKKKNMQLIQNGKYEIKKIIKKRIMPNNSEKSSLTNKNIKVEKFYPSIYIVKSNKNIQDMQTIKVKILKKNKSFNTKIFRIKPISAHKSEGTTISKEEINKRRMNSLIFTSVGNYQKKVLIDKIRVKKK